MSAKKSAAVKKAAKPKVVADTEPKFPYTTKPGSLRRLLQEIPKKPKPPKYDITLLRSWGYKDANDHSVIRVMKAVGLLNDSNEPTELYTQFMLLQGGAAALAAPIRKVYAPLFTASHEPYKESADTLRNLFNIHSGGSPSSLEQQIQTFKALCDSTSFNGAVVPQPAGAPANTPQVILPPGNNPAGGNTPTVNINLHIHLPENKTRRDYENIIEDIGRYIFGRTSEGERND